MILVEYANAFGYDRRVTPYAADVRRVWARNEIGTATMAFHAGTPFINDIIAWGNLIWIHETGLESWVGTIEERNWTAEGVVLGLKSAERLLHKKITGQNLFLPPGSTAGTFARAIYMSACHVNSYIRPTQPGFMDATKTHFKEPYDYVDCWTELQRLAKEDGADVWVDANLYVHFRNARGSDKTSSIKLREGFNLTNVAIRESMSNVVTAAVGVGAGTSMADKVKGAQLWLGDAQYYEAVTLHMAEQTSSAGINQALQQHIHTNGVPRLTIDADFINTHTPGGHWGAFQVGDYVEVILASYSEYPYRRVRIEGIEIAGEDVMRLALEVIPSERNYPFLNWTPSNAGI